MKRTKEQRGITLIALIITIVVLLILASVAISSIRNDGILGYAKDAATKYNKAQQDEKDILDYYELVLSDKAWRQNGTTVSRGDVTLKVGTVINFDSEVAGYEARIKSDSTFKWKVLGAENGHLLLVSGASVGLAQDTNGEYTGEYNGEISGLRDRFTISSINDEGKTFIEQMEELDKICAIYGKGVQAVSARCINVEDINRITGYNPNKTGTGYPYGVEGGDDDKPISDYGMTAIYKFTEDNVVQYTYTYKGETRTDTWNDGQQYNTFCKIGETTNAPELYTDAGFTATCNAYKYDVSTLTSDSTDPQIGVTDSEIIDTIIVRGWYWLNDVATRTRQGGVVYNVRYVGANFVKSKTLWDSTKSPNDISFGSEVRAVVYVNPYLDVDANGNLVPLEK